MGIGIQICGLNGCGKSTVGKALARELGFHFIDNENLYFQRTAENEPYCNERPRHEVERLLMEEVHRHENFVFAAVKGDYGAAVQPLYDYVVYLQVPGDVRAWRVRNRSFLKFGKRMLPGGDLHEKEEAFFMWWPDGRMSWWRTGCKPCPARCCAWMAGHPWKIM